MNRQHIPVNPAQFKSFLAPAAAACFTLSAVLGAAGVVLLFDPDYAAILRQQLIDGGVLSLSALNFWYLINTCITIISFVCPAVTAAGIWTALRGRYAQGLTPLSSAAQWLLRGVYLSAAVTLTYYIFRLVRYILLVLPYNEAAYHMYSLLVVEGFMGVQAWLVFQLLCKFLDCSGDCAVSIAYTLSSGKLDSMPIPSFAATGFLILGIIGLILSPGRVFTVTIVENYLQDSYKVLTASHPGQYLACATLITGAVGDFLLSAYLRYYNRVCERMRFQANRKMIT